MNKTQLRALIAKEYKSNKRFFSRKSAFVKELEQFLDAIPNNHGDFPPEVLNVLQSILKRYEHLAVNTQSYQLLNAILAGLIVIKPINLASIKPVLPELHLDYKVKNAGVVNLGVDFNGLNIKDIITTSVSGVIKGLDVNYSHPKFEPKFDFKFYKQDVGPKSSQNLSRPALTFSRDEEPLSKEIRELSDAHSVISSEGVFIGTNEADTAISAEFLTSTTNQLGGCHIGFSGWHNFDIMVMRQSGRGIICDINPNNTLFLEAMLGLIRTAEDRHDFINKAIKYINITEETFKFYPNLNDIEELYKKIETLAGEVLAELKRPSSWLYDDNSFQYIKALALADKIALITSDIRHTEQFSQLCKILGDNQVHIDSVYVSNIFGWQEKKDDQQQFIKTLRLLTAKDETILIYATLVENNLHQSAVYCADIDKDNLGTQLTQVVDSYRRIGPSAR